MADRLSNPEAEARRQEMLAALRGTLDTIDRQTEQGEDD